MIDVNRVLGALTEFPPKMSEFLSPIEDLESTIENTISSATGISLPPGPVKVVGGMIRNIEGTVGTKFVGIKAMLPKLPSLTPSGTRPVPIKVVKVSTAPTTSLGSAEVAEVTTAPKSLRGEFTAYEV